MRYLMATRQDGTKVVGEFKRLAHVARYVSQVFAGVKPFNCYVVAGDRHPASGEAVEQRVLTMLSGRTIAEVIEVERGAGAPTDSFLPEHFQPRALSDRGEAGSWRAPMENTPDGAVAGAVYPVHRDATLRRYVILNAEGHLGQPERRLMLDTGSTVTDAPIPGMDFDAEAGAEELNDDPTF